MLTLRKVLPTLNTLLLHGPQLPARLLASLLTRQYIREEGDTAASNASRRGGFPFKDGDSLRSAATVGVTVKFHLSVLKITWCYAGFVSSASVSLLLWINKGTTDLSCPNYKKKKTTTTTQRLLACAS